MTEQEFEKVINIKEEIDRIEMCIDFFTPEKMNYENESEKIRTIERIKRGWNLYLSGYRTELKISPPVLFSREKKISIDIEFVNYCRKYFEKKMDEKKLELEKL